LVTFRDDGKLTSYGSDKKGDGFVMFWAMMKIITEGSLEVKFPTIWTDEKQRWEESEKRRRKKIKQEKVSEERRSRCAKR
jgi:hypothetical protein